MLDRSLEFCSFHGHFTQISTSSCDFWFLPNEHISHGTIGKFENAVICDFSIIKDFHQCSGCCTFACIRHSFENQGILFAV